MTSYLRNILSSAGMNYDGRIGYHGDRTQYQVWASPSGAQSHALRVTGINERERVWIDAWDTRRDGLPEVADNIMTWAYNPLRLCVQPDGTVVLGGVGAAFPLNVISIWIAEYYEQYDDPRNPGEKIDFMRFYPEGAPGRYLSLAPYSEGPEVANPYLPLVIRDRPCVAPAGWPSRTEAWWIMEGAGVSVAQPKPLAEAAIA